MSVAAPTFLADESCDFGVIRALRGAGYNVVAVSELMQRSKDPELMEWAYCWKLHKPKPTRLF